MPHNGRMVRATPLRFVLPVLLGLALLWSLVGTPVHNVPAGQDVEFALERVADGFERPVYVTHAGDARLFVVEQHGRVRIVRDGAVLPTPFLDVRDRIATRGNEQGLLGLAFEPDYARTGRLYIYYTARDNGDIVIERHERDAVQPDVTDPARAQVVLRYEHGSRSNHNAGWLDFGPDGLLYVSSGDGGGAGDPYCASQNLTDLRGKLLRIEVRNQATYVAPAANQFDPAQAPEVFAIGLRNPWRMAFDRATGELWIADVGQNAAEEINVMPRNAPAGLNYGWSQREGVLAYSDTCKDSGRARVEPIFTYPRSEGQSVTGGYVYRGQRFTALLGSYLFADFASRQVWRTRRQSDDWLTEPVFKAPFAVSSFGEDVAGELYMVDFGGAVYQVTLKRAEPARRPSEFIRLNKP
jgi:glucose/arabinose dehydrogenase